MKNVLIGVLVVAVIVLGYLAFKPKIASVSPVSVNSSTDTTPAVNSNTDNSQSQQNISWVQDKNTGYYYPQGSTANTTEKSILKISYNGLTIDLGEFQYACNENTYNFQYGISTQACVTNGVIATASSNTASVLTVDQKKLFGDFVLKNKFIATVKISTGNIFSSSSDHFSLSLPTNMNLAEDPIGSGRYYVKYARGVTPQLPYFRNITVSNEPCLAGESVTIDNIQYTRTDDTDGGMESSSLVSSYCTIHAGKTYAVIFSWTFPRFTGTAPDRSTATTKFNNELDQLQLQFI